MTKRNGIVFELMIGGYSKVLKEFARSVIRVEGKMQDGECVDVMNIDIHDNDRAKHFQNNVKLGIMLNKSLVRGNRLTLYVNGMPYISTYTGKIRTAAKVGLTGASAGIIGSSVWFETNNKELARYPVARELMGLIQKELPRFRKEVSRREKERAGLK